MGKLILTPRLQRVADFVSHHRVADIGTDHGKLLIALAQKGDLEKGIGSDVAQGPASACRGNVSAFGFADKIEIRVGDGLKTLTPGEAETVVIAGMGGELIAKILSDSPGVVAKTQEFVLQPMTNSDKLLKMLPELGIKITDGCLAQEGDKLYRIFKCESGQSTLTDFETVICPVLRKDPLLPLLIKNELTKARIKYAGLQQGKTDAKAECDALRVLIKELESYEA